MVCWITTQLGVKPVDGELKESEYGSVIVDLRNVPDMSFLDKTEAEKKEALVKYVPMVLETIQKIFKIVSQRDIKVILQCQGGISRSPSFVVGILVYGTLMEWDDAQEFVKKKCPEAQFNEDLMLCIKMVVSGK
jgi:protein-tyrosine phosphatase